MANIVSERKRNLRKLAVSAFVAIRDGMAEKDLPQHLGVSEAEVGQLMLLNEFRISVENAKKMIAVKDCPEIHDVAISPTNLYEKCPKTGRYTRRKFIADKDIPDNYIRSMSKVR